MTNTTGQLFLVSAGIGDADNITLRAQKIVASADIVFAMDFVRDQFTDLLADKEVHNSGHGLFTKLSINTGSKNQENTIRRIIREGYTAGKTIVIMDFGDPTMYSPQSSYLKEFADLQPKIIPGISSFNASNAAIGCELTGSYNRAVIITEAMQNWDGARERLQKLAATQSTLAFFSMRLDLKQVVSDLKQHYPASTPVAIVTHAGFADKESVIRGTLNTIIEQTQNTPLPWQNMIYVGDFLN